MSALDAALGAFSDEVAKVGSLHKDGMTAALDAANGVMFSAERIALVALELERAIEDSLPASVRARLIADIFRGDL